MGLEFLSRESTLLSTLKAVLFAKEEVIVENELESLTRTTPP